VQVQHFILIFV